MATQVRIAAGFVAVSSRVQNARLPLPGAGPRVKPRFCGVLFRGHAHVTPEGPVLHDPHHSSQVGRAPLVRKRAHHLGPPPHRNPSPSVPLTRLWWSLASRQNVEGKAHHAPLPGLGHRRLAGRGKGSAPPGGKLLLQPLGHPGDRVLSDPHPGQALGWPPPRRWRDGLLYQPGHPPVPRKDLRQESPFSVPGCPQPRDLAYWSDRLPGVGAVPLPAVARGPLAVAGGQGCGHLPFRHLLHNGLHTLPDAPAAPPGSSSGALPGPSASPRLAHLQNERPYPQDLRGLVAPQVGQEHQACQTGGAASRTMGLG